MVLKEFKEFALKGNVLDLAIGVVIGAAFGKIVTSLVSDILQPILSLMLGKVDFSNRFVTLTHGNFDSLASAHAAGAVTLNYGLFINAVIDFLIIAWVIFMLVKQINRLKRQAPQPDATMKQCSHCFSQIDLRATRCPHCTSTF